MLTHFVQNSQKHTQNRMIGEKILGISAAATLKTIENYIKILTIKINKTKMQFQTAEGSFQLKTDSGDLRLASLESIQGCLCCFCLHTRPSWTPLKNFFQHGGGRFMITLHTTSSPRWMQWMLVVEIFLLKPARDGSDIQEDITLGALPEKI